MSRLIDAFHSAIYSWSHENGLGIKIVSVLVLGLAALIFFKPQQSVSRHRAADATFWILALFLLAMSILDFYRWGADSFWLFAWQWGSLATSAIAYYLPMRIMKRSSKVVVALSSIIFIASGWVFVEVFFLSSIIPVNVMINWG
jgi:hypothetical protein